MSGIDSAPVLTAPPRAVHVTVTDDTLSVDIDGGRMIAVPKRIKTRQVGGRKASVRRSVPRRRPDRFDMMELDQPIYTTLPSRSINIWVD